MEIDAKILHHVTHLPYFTPSSVESFEWSTLCHLQSSNLILTRSSNCTIDFPSPSLFDRHIEKRIRSPNRNHG